MKSNRKYLKGRRKDLRNNATSAENILWSKLKGKQLKNRKFRRQHSIKNYIVDFICLPDKLILEIDELIHDDITNKANDEIRDAELNHLGYKVLRYDNYSIYDNLEEVLEDISKHLKD